MTLLMWKPIIFYPSKLTRHSKTITFDSFLTSENRKFVRSTLYKLICAFLFLRHLSMNCDPLCFVRRFGIIRFRLFSFSLRTFQTTQSRCSWLVGFKKEWSSSSPLHLKNAVMAPGSTAPWILCSLVFTPIISPTYLLLRLSLLSIIPNLDWTKHYK